MMVNARKFIDATIYKDIPYDPKSMEDEFFAMMESGMCVIATDDEGTHLGGIGAVLSPLYLNKSIKVAGERFYWVDDKARSLGVGKALYSAFHKAAKASGAQYLMMISLADEKTDSLYRSLGMVEAEHSFWSSL